MLPSLVNEFAMTRIDSHQHFWRYDPVEYAPWPANDALLGKIERGIGRDRLLDDLLAELHGRRQEDGIPFIRGRV